MKSLEIVNSILDDNQDCFIMQYVTYYEMEIIKQDLEVLEIIKNKRVDVNDIYICDRYELYIIYMKNLEIAEESILTLEEFNKIKKWIGEK